jgi:hypothetical protein
MVGLWRAQSAQFDRESVSSNEVALRTIDETELLAPLFAVACLDKSADRAARRRAGISPSPRAKLVLTSHRERTHDIARVVESPAK